MDDDDFFNEDDAEIKPVRRLLKRKSKDTASQKSPKPESPSWSSHGGRENSLSTCRAEGAAETEFPAITGNSALAVNEVESLKTKLTDAEAALVQARQDVAELQKQLSVETAKVVSAADEVQCCVHRAEQAERALADLEHKWQLVTQELETERKRRNDAESALNGTKRGLHAIQELESALNAIRKENLQNLNEKTQLASKLSAMAEELQKVQTRCEKLHVSSTEASQALAQKKQEADQLERRLKEQSDKNKNIEQQLREAKSGKDWKRSSEELSRQLLTLRSQYDAMERSNKQLQAEVERLRSEGSASAISPLISAKTNSGNKETNNGFSLDGSIFS